MLRRPLLIHEQNSIAGLSNRVLARLAARVLSGFPQVLPGAEWCGNPVRDSIAALPEPPARYTVRSGTLSVLVVGGSLGAKAITNVCRTHWRCCRKASVQASYTRPANNTSMRCWLPINRRA